MIEIKKINRWYAVAMALVAVVFLLHSLILVPALDSLEAAREAVNPGPIMAEHWKRQSSLIYQISQSADDTVGYLPSAFVVWVVVGAIGYGVIRFTAACFSWASRSE